jgi:hypothetical protein
MSLGPGSTPRLCHRSRCKSASRETRPHFFRKAWSNPRVSLGAPLLWIHHPCRSRLGIRDSPFRVNLFWNSRSLCDAVRSLRKIAGSVKSRAASRKDSGESLWHRPIRSFHDHRDIHDWELPHSIMPRRRFHSAGSFMAARFPETETSCDASNASRETRATARTARPISS